MARELVVSQPFAAYGVHYERGEHISDPKLVAEFARRKEVRAIIVPDPPKPAPTPPAPKPAA